MLKISLVYSNGVGMRPPPSGHYRHLRGERVGFDVSHEAICRMGLPGRRKEDASPSTANDVSSVLFLGDKSTQSLLSWSNLRAASFVALNVPFEAREVGRVLQEVEGSSSSGRRGGRGRRIVVLGNAVADLRSSAHEDLFLRHARQLDKAVQIMRQDYSTTYPVHHRYIGAPSCNIVSSRLVRTTYYTIWWGDLLNVFLIQ